MYELEWLTKTKQGIYFNSFSTSEKHQEKTVWHLGYIFWFLFFRYLYIFLFNPCVHNSLYTGKRFDHQMVKSIFGTNDFFTDLRQICTTYFPELASHSAWEAWSAISMGSQDTRRWMDGYSQLEWWWDLCFTYSHITPSFGAFNIVACRLG